jgi:hypothetical protein
LLTPPPGSVLTLRCRWFDIFPRSFQYSYDVQHRESPRARMTILIGLGLAKRARQRNRAYRERSRNGNLFVVHTQKSTLSKSGVRCQLMCCRAFVAPRSGVF